MTAWASASPTRRSTSRSSSARRASAKGCPLIPSASAARLLRCRSFPRCARSTSGASSPASPACSSAHDNDQRDTMKRIHAAGPILAAALTLRPAVAGASDAAMAKLVECMKLKAASPEQQACLKQVETLHAAAKPAPAAIKAPKMAAAVAPGARPVAKAAPPTVIAVPPEVKHAAAEVGLAGAPAQAKTVSAGSSISRICGGIPGRHLKGLDLGSPMNALQSQRANLLHARRKD